MIHRIETPTPFAVGDVNVHIVKGDALSIFDAATKTEEALQAMTNGIKALGYELTDIEQVVLTHHHTDHIGWTDAFPNAEIVGHIYNDAWLRRDPTFLNSHFEFYKKCLIEENVPQQYFSWVERMTRRPDKMGTTPLTTILYDGDEVPGHPGLIAIETLGHAQSHLAYWHKEKKEMIGGDLLINYIASNPLIEPPLNPNQPRAKSLLQYNESLKKLLDLPIEILHSGHGDPITNVHELVQQRLAKQHTRAMRVLQYIEEGTDTIFELSSRVFPKKYISELGLTLSQTIGQIDYLVSLDLIKETKDEQGILHYEKN